jgi:GntR family transcriptional regulator, rspAB operon transcriptional repressor
MHSSRILRDRFVSSIKKERHSSMDPATIYEDLKEKIIWLDISPDSTLNQVELAEAYGVSRNPVTVALTRLAAEDWVVRHGSHFVVSPLTLVRMREITEIRSVLETQANLWAMHRMTPAGLEELKALGNKIEKLSQGASRKEMVRLDFDFHRIIYRETQNHYLAQMLERLLSQYLRFWLSGPQEIKKAALFDDTLAMIKAMESKDEISLRASTAAHIKLSLDKIMSLP